MKKIVFGYKPFINKKYTLFFEDGHYYLFRGHKKVTDTISFYSIYKYMIERNYNINNVYLKSMSLYDFLNNWASFDDDKSSGGGRI